MPGNSYVVVLCILCFYVVGFTSVEEYKNVNLKCGSNSMSVDLEMKEDFTGVIYTKGSFHDKKAPCYLDMENKRGERSFTMKFPLDDCQTLQKGNVYSNVLVVQHDKDLIMPGDAAFNLECDFRQPREITVGADMQSASKIMLVDIAESRNLLSPIKNHVNIVTIRPEGNNQQSKVQAKSRSRVHLQAR